MTFSKKPIIRFGLLTLAAVLLIATRFINLSTTARFTFDEASDLSRMYQLGNHFKITLVGPISNDNSKVFGSLTYYMLLPFVMVFQYSAVSPAIGMAFWSCILAVLLLLLTKRLNRQFLWLMMVLVVVWYPLVETGRWGWNPHLMPVWLVGGLLVYTFHKRWSYGLSGFLMGLAVHHHYIALVAILGFLVSETMLQLSKTSIALRERIFRIGLLVVGVIGSLLPFLLFDLRHPPGLFFTRYIMSGSVPNVGAGSESSFLQNIFLSINYSFRYLSGETWLVWILGFLVVILIFLDSKKRKTALMRLLPVLFQLIGMSFLDVFATRYFLPAIPFYIYWLLYPRKDAISMLCARLIILIMIIGSAFSIPRLLLESRVQPSPYAFDKIVSQIRIAMNESPTKDVNLAVLASPDSAPLGESYRSILGMHGVALKAASEYDTTSRLFVISTSDESVVRQDKSIAMLDFRNVPLHQEYKIDGTEWVVYWFQK